MTSTTLPPGQRIWLNSILYLTDFSAPSEAALPFCVALAREYGAVVHALHVLTPTTFAYTTPDLMPATIRAAEETAEYELQRLEARLDGVGHDSSFKRAADVWPAVDDAIHENKADLIVLGTHGRTGAQKLLMGSVAEEIFRRAPVPVLTIGPQVNRGLHNAARFRRILYATDFTPESLAAAPWAISMAQENQAHLLLLNVMRPRELQAHERCAEETIANSMHHLHELVPPSAELWCRPEAFVQYGDPAGKILESAQELAADLIVLGLRNATGYLGPTTHLARSTAQSVVARAHCPVLTVRAQQLECATAKDRRAASICALSPQVAI